MDSVNQPARMRVEYVDGGECSLDSNDLNSNGEDGSPTSLPEVYDPHIPPYDLLDRTKTMRPPSISSSSSATTSSGELFQIIPHEVLKSSGRLLSNSDDKEETVSPIATEVVVSDINGVVLGASPTQSPPVQVMNRSSGASHDPCRIPAAVFETCDTMTEVNWSNASADSLFSIQIGNVSFMKDRRGNAWCRESIRPKRSLTMTPDCWKKPSSPPSEEVAADGEDMKRPEESKQSEETPTVVEKEAKEDPIEETIVIHRESLNLPDKIEASPMNYSFSSKKKISIRKSSRSRCLRIFPCLAWPSWCFSTCYRPLCKYPSCKCRFPSCSCCSCSLALCFCEHPCCSCTGQRCGCSSIGLAICYVCSCKPLKLLCCVTGPSSKEHVTEKHGYKVGCFSCMSSCCFPCGSCRQCFSSCLSCSFPCCSRHWWRCRPHCC